MKKLNLQECLAHAAELRSLMATAMKLLVRKNARACPAFFGSASDSSYSHWAGIGTGAAVLVLLFGFASNVARADEYVAYAAVYGEGNQVAVIDLGDHQNPSICTRIPLPGFPPGIAVSLDESRLYVTNFFGDEVSVIDRATNSVTATLDYWAPNSWPYQVTVSPGGLVYVGNDSGSTEVTIIDPVDNSVTQTVFLERGGAAEDIVFTTDGAYAYVGGNGISQINTATYEVENVPSLSGTRPLYLALSPDGKYLYASQEQTSIAADPATGRRTGILSVIDTDPNSGTYLTEVATITLNATEPYHLNYHSSPRDLAFRPNSTELWVPLGSGNQISIIDTQATSPLAQLEVEKISSVVFPNTVRFSPDGVYAYVSGAGGVFSIYDAETRALVSTVSLGGTHDMVIATTSGLSCGAPMETDVDTDGDGVPDDQDICPGGDDALDADDDGTPDFCDPDDDNDGFPDTMDICPGGNDSLDGDADNVPNFCDACPFDSTNDADGDGLCGTLPMCVAGNGELDTDGDEAVDSCDVCPLDAENDADNDGICETGGGEGQSGDNCPVIANDNQSDIDDDGIGDACDPDIDGDGYLNDGDNCKFDANDQTDTDDDGQGDVCDDDLDGDGVHDAGDACIPSPSGDPVNAEGCAIVELCPCDNTWKNHGAYVKCVAHAANDFRDAGLISDAEHGEIVSEAGGSDCGHK